MVKIMAEALMSAEADTLCGADYGRRSSERTNPRNGYRACANAGAASPTARPRAVLETARLKLAITESAVGIALSGSRVRGRAAGPRGRSGRCPMGVGAHSPEGCRSWLIMRFSLRE
jgi:hypothetical protein